LSRSAPFDEQIGFAAARRVEASRAADVERHSTGFAARHEVEPTVCRNYVKLIRRPNMIGPRAPRRVVTSPVDAALATIGAHGS
jgi:hypothetical protein